MLLQLHVKNLALIDEAEVDFEEGLNILTGETGAGKSVLLGSVNLALGAKADKDLIRQGAEYALVEIVFRLDNDAQCEAVRQLELPIEEDGILILQRKIMPNRSISKVCGETVTVSQLKELAPILLDVYGQHDYQSLMHAGKHLAVLDSFAGEELKTCMEEYRRCYESYCDIRRRLEEPEMSEAERERELSFALYEAEEIEQANLKEGELEELESRLNRMENHEKLMRSVSAALYLLKESEPSCVSSVERSVRELNSCASSDEQVAEMAKRLEALDMDLSYLVRDLTVYMEESEFDEEEYQMVHERVNLLNRLMMKYGRTVSDVIAYAERKRERIEYLMNAGDAKLKLESLFGQRKRELAAFADEITSLRKKEAKLLEAEIKEALIALNFLQVDFEMQFTQTEDFTVNGRDKVVFMISTNVGEALKPLSSVASGGELSRIMLAIKTVSARRDEINTLIFDEIDSGISGKTAWKVSEMLGKLAKERQIISITHLPQIAAMADTHFNILKTEDGEKTRTEILRMDEQEALHEVARLLGADIITEAALENARELREQAQNVKITL